MTDLPGGKPPPGEIPRRNVAITSAGVEKVSFRNAERLLKLTCRHLHPKFDEQM